MKSEKVVAKALCRRWVLLAGVAVIVALLAATAVAAPAGKVGLNKTALDPAASRPIWVLRTTASPDPMLAEVVHGLRGIDRYGQGPIVNVPARPKPRSPFMPPSEISLSDLPPWVLGQ